MAPAPDRGPLALAILRRGSPSPRGEGVIPSNFVVFFEEKEGTSPLVRLLDRFERISIVHQVGDAGWEPFDPHNCGPMPLADLAACLDLLLGAGPLDLARLNAIYTRTAAKPLAPVDQSGSVGLKMRFRPPRQAVRAEPSARWWRRARARREAARESRHFQAAMLDVLRRNRAVACLAVRQDLLRWALSRYHGDGTGRPGHLQFKLARGEIRRDQIASIRVDCARLERLIEGCEAAHRRKRALRDALERAGIPVFPLRYEDFCSDPRAYFARLGEILEPHCLRRRSSAPSPAAPTSRRSTPTASPSSSRTTSRCWSASATASSPGAEGRPRPR